MDSDQVKTATIVSALVDMLIEKNQAYGVDNIKFTGMDGISIRILDKAWRIRNLLEHPDIPNHFESVQDTYLDITGYCIIGLCLLSDKWRAWDETFHNDLSQFASLMTNFDLIPGETQAQLSILADAKELYKSNRQKIEVAWMIRQLIKIGRESLYCLVWLGK